MTNLFRIKIQMIKKMQRKGLLKSLKHMPLFLIQQKEKPMIVLPLPIRVNSDSNQVMDINGKIQNSVQTLIIFQECRIMVQEQVKILKDKKFLILNPCSNPLTRLLSIPLTISLSNSENLHLRWLIRYLTKYSHKHLTSIKIYL